MLSFEVERNVGTLFWKVKCEFLRFALYWKIQQVVTNNLSEPVQREDSLVKLKMRLAHACRRFYVDLLYRRTRSIYAFSVGPKGKYGRPHFCLHCKFENKTASKPDDQSIFNSLKFISETVWSSPFVFSDLSPFQKNFEDLNKMPRLSEADKRARFICPVCQKQFSLKNSRDVHMIVIHEVGPMRSLFELAHEPYPF